MKSICGPQPSRQAAQLHWTSGVCMSTLASKHDWSTALTLSSLCITHCKVLGFSPKKLLDYNHTKYSNLMHLIWMFSEKSKTNTSSPNVSEVEVIYSHWSNKEPWSFKLSDVAPVSFCCTAQLVKSSVHSDDMLKVSAILQLTEKESPYLDVETTSSAKVDNKYCVPVAVSQ